MANISTELAAIMAAVFGRDVRQSIHDAIDKVNRVSEVCLTAGTAVSSASSSSTGFYEGSLYINTNTFELWKCIGTNSWQSLGIFRGDDGRGIWSIEKTATVGLVDTYTITFTDQSQTTFDITNGQNGIDGKDGSVWYKGTALTGTGTGVVGFPGKKDDWYLNYDTGYVYCCTRTGAGQAPDAALWDFIMILSGGGGTSIAVIDDLNHQSASDALSANQGYVLNTTKISLPANPSPGDVLTYNNGGWAGAQPSGGGHTMTPLPTTIGAYADKGAERAVVSGVAASTKSNDHVPSLFGVKIWSNVCQMRFVYTGGLNDNGIGTWQDDLSELDGLNTAQKDAKEGSDWGWWKISDLILNTTDPTAVDTDGQLTYVDPDSINFQPIFDVDVDPTTLEAKQTLALGGYIVDTDTGRVCIRTANEIQDITNVRIGIDATFMRTCVS